MADITFPGPSDEAPLRLFDNGDGSYSTIGRSAPVFKEIKALAITAATPASVWTPATGKRFVILGWCLSLSVAGEIYFEDATGAEVLRTPALLAGTPYSATLGASGLQSAAANNHLFLDVSASGTVNGYVYGAEIV